MFKRSFIYLFTIVYLIVGLEAEGVPLAEVGTKGSYGEAAIVGDFSGNMPFTIDYYDEKVTIFGFNESHMAKVRFDLEKGEFQKLQVVFGDGLVLDFVDEDLWNPSSSPVSPYKNFPFHSRDSFKVKQSWKTSNESWQPTTTTFSFSHLKKSYCANKKELLSPFQYVGWGMWEYMSTTPYGTSHGVRYSTDHRFGLAAFGTDSLATSMTDSFEYSGPSFFYIPYSTIRPDQSQGRVELSFHLDEGVFSGAIMLGEGDEIELINGVIHVEETGMPFEADVTYNGEEIFGKLRGRFYGPNGEEVAGVFLLNRWKDDEPEDITGVFAGLIKN